MWGKCSDVRPGWGLDQVQNSALHYLQRVEENKRLNFYTFELVWNTTGQYSVTGLRQTCKFRKKCTY